MSGIKYLIEKEAFELLEKVISGFAKRCESIAESHGALTILNGVKNTLVEHVDNDAVEQEMAKQE